MNTIWIIIGTSVILVALTLCLCVTTVCIRMLRKDTASPSVAQLQTGVMAGSIALFGILVTGVFVITVFRIDVDVTNTFESVVADRVNQAVPRLLAPHLATFEEDTARLVQDISDEAGRLASRTFGNWEPIDTYDELRQADTSGFIFAFINVTGNRENFTTPINFHIGESNEEALSEVAWLFRSRDRVLIPVRAGEYWRITGSRTTFNNAEIRWIPMFQRDNSNPSE